MQRDKLLKYGDMAEVIDKNEVDEEMRLLQRAVIEAEGGRLYGSEIF